MRRLDPFIDHSVLAAVLALTLLATSSSVVRAAVTIGGAFRTWQPLTLDFTGPTLNETDNAPNPFLDYRLQVVFTAADGVAYNVPGFFAGDGRGGTTGDVWRVRFTPDKPGAWTYRASFRTGDAVAVDLAPDAGTAVALDGANGAIEIEAVDPEAPGFFRWGRLEYVGKHYLKFRDGPYWLRGGVDTPENFLAYAGFDDTPPSHKYAAHREDWKEGDPDWGDGRGRAIIGAVNYLAAQHVNSIYALTMNVGGDGKDVWPWSERPRRKGSTDNDNLHFDNSKLDQWNTVFTHAQSKGVFLHLVLNEAEHANKQELDEGELGVERKLYYRELAAQFGHHLALEWNLCEEYNIGFDLGAERVIAFADYLRAIDPYGHPITVHSAGDPAKALAFTFGDERFSLTSIQLGQRRIDHVAEAIRQATIEAGRPLPVSLDEFTVDVGQGASWKPIDDVDKMRREKLWPAYFSGGMVELILEGLLNVDSFKTPTKTALWRAMWHARRFVETELPFWELAPHDGLVRGAAVIEVGMGKGKKSLLGAQVFCKPGAVCAVYLPTAATTGEIDLSASDATWTQRWYNPRQGEFRGETRRLAGGGWAALGTPPSEPEQDWVALLKAEEDQPPKSVQLFPDAAWQAVDPQQAGLDLHKLDALADLLGGRGVVIKDGRVAKSWGDQAQKSDWYSAAKPVLGTLLLFAIAEGKVDGVDAPVADFGWDLSAKDKPMTLRQLANMTSGYARPEPPGQAWAYNDFGIQLYQQTIFDRLFRDRPESTANDPSRFGALGLEDGLSFAKKNRRLKASVRDFARISWFWLNRGNWNGRQLIPGHLFDEVMRPQTPRELPHTAQAETNDYLGIGSFGGGSDHFTKHGPGVYGFNWWFNTTGRLNPQTKTWPDAPDDLVMAIGFGGNCCALLPSENAVLVAAEADWGKLLAGQRDNQMNHVLSAFADAVTTDAVTTDADTADARRVCPDRRGFKKIVLTRQYLCDGVAVGDINQDGNVDVVAGPYWYAGPAFRDRRAFYAATPLAPERSPSNSMFSFVYDFNSDGWPDILTLGRVHLHPAYWYENPGANPGNDTAQWRKHYAFERVQGESPTLVDLDDDGRPQLVCHWEGRWGWIEPHWNAPTEPWRFQPLSDQSEWKEFYHGTGVGDVNGDGRLDLVINDGWFEQSLAARSRWTWHPHKFSQGRGGAQMFVDDVDDDGDADVITSLDAHGWGLAWFEQVDHNGTIAFRRRPFMGTREEQGQYGAAFTQPHALELADVNGDGLKDLVTGKRMWAHGPRGDIEPNAAPVLYWFELQRTEDAVRFVPHLVDDRSGVGVQIAVADVNGDGANDILTSSKLGSFVFLNVQ